MQQLPSYCQSMPLSRRGLLGAGLSFFAWSHLPKTASAAGTRDPRFLTVILRGALDGLSAVAPLGDPDYEALRVGIALSKEGKDAAIPLDGFFALHPKMPNFARAYAAKQALVVHATASPYRERSHFDGQDVLETGLGGVGRTDTGWLNRALLALPKGDRIARQGGLGVGTVTSFCAARRRFWAGRPSASPKRRRISRGVFSISTSIAIRFSPRRWPAASRPTSSRKVARNWSRAAAIPP